MTVDERYFNDHYDLARLPYFKLGDGGRLMISDPAFGPSIDMHTHLALAYVLPMSLNLHKKHPRTLHYLPMERPLDLDIYANQNFLKGDLTRMKLDLTLLGATPLGMRATHTIPNLIQEMKELGIAHSLLLPVDHATPLSRNAEVYLKESAPYPELLSFGSVHPYDPNIVGRLDKQKALGARGVKYHPMAQMIAPNHPKAMKLYKLLSDRNMMVLYHCGPVGIEPKPGRRRSQVKLYEAPIAENPEVIFLLGHSGALQFDLALEFANLYPNVYLESSSQQLTNVRRMIEEGPVDRIVFGTDWPFYHQAIALAKLLLATEGDEEVRKKVLYENAAKLMGLI